MNAALISRWWFGLMAGLALAPVGWADTDANQVYQTHCASCHGADRLGGAGPALLPGNLARLRLYHKNRSQHNSN